MGVSSSKGGFRAAFPADQEPDPEDADEDILGARQQFHDTVRDNIVFMIFFLVLYMMSWYTIGAFVKRGIREKEEQQRKEFIVQGDDDESLVYRICFWLCVFALSISMGATLLLPISIVSNEVLLLYPKTYYVQWLNGRLIQGLWNLIFLFANLSLFILLPFAYLFIESEGFSGNKKGLMGKFYETVVVLILSGFAIWGISHILSAVLSSERSILSGLFLNFIGFSDQLPFVYSCISFCGALLLLLCTPVGAGKLFTVLSQLLVGPQFLRNLEEEHRQKFLEMETLRNSLRKKLANNVRMRRDLLSIYESKKAELQRRRERKQKQDLQFQEEKEAKEDKGKKNGNGAFDIIKLKEKWEKVCRELEGFGDEEEDEDDVEMDRAVNQRDSEFVKLYHRMLSLSPHDEVDETEDAIKERIKETEIELINLEKLKKIPGWKRNLLYPLALLFVLALTALMVFMVVINTLQLVVGLKALPVSAQTVSLGLSSMSVLGAWGAGIEIVLILYLMTTSVIGLYSLPGIRKVRPLTGETQTSHIIYNCGLVLILSSALPLLSRILGITNFDLLGNYGKIEWLGNFYIVFLYNFIFSVALTLCLVNKFTSAIRQELLSRLRSAFRFLPFSSKSPSRVDREKSPFLLQNGASPNNTPVRPKSATNGSRLSVTPTTSQSSKKNN